MQPARVTIVTVLFNSAETIAGFLDTLDAGAAGVPYDLVAVDNCSPDDSVAVVRARAPHATIVELGENRGYSAGINAAVAAAPHGDAVLVVNPDVRLEPGVVAELVRGLDEPGVGIVAPRLADENGALQYSLRRDATVTRAWGEALVGGTRARRSPRLSQTDGDPESYETSHDVEWASGALLLVSRACFDRTGPWDESFFLYCEEEEFQQRARAAGFRVRFCPAAHAVHIGGDMHRAGNLWALGMVNRLRLYARSHGRGETAALRAALVVNEMLRARDPAHRYGLRALLSRDALTPGMRP